MRVTLVNPPPTRRGPFIREGRCMQSADSWAAVWPPLSLAVLAAMARQRGWQVDLVDGNVEPGLNTARLVDRLEAFDPQLVLLNAALPAITADARHNPARIGQQTDKQDEQRIRNGVTF